MPKNQIKKEVKKIVLSVLKAPNAFEYSHGILADRIAEKVVEMLDNKV